MWEAAISGIAAVAVQRGWPHKTRDDLRHVIHHLDHDGENPPMKVSPLNSYYAKWVVVKMYHEHAVTEDDEWDYDGEFRMEPISLKYSQKSMRRLIDNLESEIARGVESV